MIYCQVVEQSHKAEGHKMTQEHPVVHFGVLHEQRMITVTVVAYTMSFLSN